MKSWKIGAIAGLIAGIIGGIVSIFYAIYALKIGLGYYLLEALSFIPVKQIAIVEIIVNIIWGIVFGIIYSKVYEIIPGKGISKGLVFGLIYYFIYCFRMFVLNLMYWAPWYSFTWLYMIVVYIPFGLVLGISYEFLSRKFPAKKERIVAIKYNIKSGINPGAIAGLAQGFVVFIGQLLIFNKEIYPKYASDLTFLISQLGTHAFFNMAWGIVFGIFYVMFYDKVPRKGIMKGFIYSMIILFFTSFHAGIYALMHGWLILGMQFIILPFFGFFSFGIVLGLLYKPKK